jgi:hypothetical protein
MTQDPVATSRDCRPWPAAALVSVKSLNYSPADWSDAARLLMLGTGMVMLAQEVVTDEGNLISKERTEQRDPLSSLLDP